MARTHSRTAGFAVQQVQEVPADRVVVGLDFDAPAVVAIVMPVEQHGAERGQQAIGDRRARRLRRGSSRLGQHAAQHRHAGAQHVHGMRGGREQFERLL